MKKRFVAGAVLAGMLLAGCTSVESTQKFNAISLGSGDEKAVCHSFVKMTGLFFCGLPLVVGSTRGDGTCTAFCFNLTEENALYLLTKEVKSKGATRLVNPQVSYTADYSYFIFSIESIQASGTGVRSRDAAMRQAAKDFDNEP
ncbi:MAG: hypothetical protein MJ016_01025 [Victivallaceae bacterium]|nr:hypothetical protein [Victivallaceae bacterium]